MPELCFSNLKNESIFHILNFGSFVFATSSLLDFVASLCCDFKFIIRLFVLDPAAFKIAWYSLHFAFAVCEVLLHFRFS